MARIYGALVQMGFTLGKAIRPATGCETYPMTKKRMDREAKNLG
jgi:hypothetical protein